jgi:hypothetical protein
VRVLVARSDTDADALAKSGRHGIARPERVAGSYAVATRSYAAHRSYGVERALGYRVPARR